MFKYSIKLNPWKKSHFDGMLGPEYQVTDEHNVLSFGDRLQPEGHEQLLQHGLDLQHSKLLANAITGTCKRRSPIKLMVCYSGRN